MSNPRSFILAYGCSSSAGPKTEDFLKRLHSSGSESRNLKWIGDSITAQEMILSQLQNAWQQTLRELLRTGTLLSQKKLGIIFASTKGSIDDSVWNPSADLSCDSLTPILDAFIRENELHPQESLCVSNACASSLSALYLAQQWLKQNRVEQILILAADRIGPFVTQGFECLHALSSGNAKPFAKNRDGLNLGDAAAVLLLGKEPSPFELVGVSINTEGYAATRPSPSGASLKRAYLNLKKEMSDANSIPDLIIAHGTGTVLNDSVEDKVFTELFGNKIPITGTKWCIGHTLGASGAMDLIAACEVIKTQTPFRLQTTDEVDPLFTANYLSRNAPELNLPIDSVLISSLGFGGIHALAQVKRNASSEGAASR